MTTGLKKPNPAAAESVPDNDPASAGTGACCLQAACSDTMSQQLCQIFGGIWFPGVDCTSDVCDADGAYCSAGFVLDCVGNCVPENWVGDGFCDDGSFEFNGNIVYLNCAEHACDGGDCADSSCDLPAFEGACCTDSGCLSLTYADCIALNGVYMGESTQCTSSTCSCPSGYIPDCNGYCIPIFLLGDGICQHGEYLDNYDQHYGEPGISTFDMLCPELACDSGDCIGGGCIGACCINGSCSDDITFEQCIQLGGTYQGALTLCADVSCEDDIRSLLVTDHTLIRPHQGNSGNGLQDEGGIGFSCASHGNMAVIGHSDVRSTGIGFRLAASIYYDGSQTATQTIYPDFDSGLASRVAAVDTDGDSIVLTGKAFAAIYHKPGSEWIQQELIIGSGNDYAAAAISGDRLYLGEPESNHVVVLNRTGNSWNETTCLVSPVEDSEFGTTLSADSNTLVITDRSTVYVYDTATLTLQFTHPIYGRHTYDPRFIVSLGPANDVDVEGDYFILGDAGLPDASGFGHLFKKTNGQWSSHQILTPAVAGGSEVKIGYAVALHDGTAIVTAPQASEMEVQSGGAYLFADLNDTWVELARIARPSSGINDGLGVSACIGDQIWLGRCQNIYELWAPDIFESIEVVTMPDHLWIDEDYGDVNVASNWFPTAPTPGSTATMNIQAPYTVYTLDGTLPFDSLNIGPGSPTLDLLSSSTTIGGSIDIAGIGSMYSTLGLYQGVLSVQGPVTAGGPTTPGTINITSSAQLRALDSYTQLGLGTLSCQISDSSLPALYVEGGLEINGSLKLTNDGNYVPPGGRSVFTILHSDQPPSVDSNRFKISIMPGRDDGKFYKLIYGDEGRGGYTIQIVTEDLPVDGSLSSPDEIGVSGQATDVLVADLFGPEGGGLDGFDDIALTIDGSPGSLYLFVNDGNGGISLQTTYPTGNGPTALTAGDMDNDGIPDIIATNGLDDTLQYWLNPDADATTLAAQAPIATGSMPVNLIAHDIDGDIDDDIVVTCAGDGTPDPATGEYYGVVQFFQSDGTRSRALTPKQEIVVNNQPRGISPGEIDNPGDKQDDILVSLGAASHIVRLANPGNDSDWTIDQTIEVGTGPNTIEPLRIGGPVGTVFLVANEGSDSISVVAPDNTGTLGVIASVDVEATPIGMTTVDMDGDSDRDLAMLVRSNFGNDIRIYRNDTDATTDSGILLALDDVLIDNDRPVLIANGDTDNDGNDDLVSITGSEPGRRSGAETLSVRRSGEVVDACTGDIDGDNDVNVIDLLALIGAWGPCDTCTEDLDANGTVDVIDLLALIGAWGACP